MSKQHNQNIALEHPSRNSLEAKYIHRTHLHTLANLLAIFPTTRVRNLGKAPAILFFSASNIFPISLRCLVSGRRDARPRNKFRRILGRQIGPIGKQFSAFHIDNQSSTSLVAAHFRPSVTSVDRLIIGNARRRSCKRARSRKSSRDGMIFDSSRETGQRREDRTDANFARTEGQWPRVAALSSGSVGRRTTEHFVPSRHLPLSRSAISRRPPTALARQHLPVG